ncbi:hypothetical protein vBAmePR8F_gp08 [Alteromonas phage vB_AmeP_R8W]|uniref:Uncharacterized protein n=1 Tax=Alteromonas phage vB_AmeP_R8W TaxID=2774152 RepID=A0A8E4RG08_9CAUD|nr:hypothetical protein vBAmePR8F_gp08 [Alteromonas phage vB_AmeP_R8W]
MSNGFHQTATANVGTDGCGVTGKVCVGGDNATSRGVSINDDWVARNNAKPKVVRRVQRKCCYEQD